MAVRIAEQSGFRKGRTLVLLFLHPLTEFGSEAAEGLRMFRLGGQIAEFMGIGSEIVEFLPRTSVIAPQDGRRSRIRARRSLP